jgi:hypothetical protein
VDEVVGYDFEWRCSGRGPARDAWVLRVSREGLGVRKLAAVEKEEAEAEDEEALDFLGA